MVSHEEGIALAKEFNVKFFETSAMTGNGVKESFLYLASHAKNRILSADADLLTAQSAPPVRLSTKVQELASVSVCSC